MYYVCVSVTSPGLLYFCNIFALNSLRFLQSLPITAVFGFPDEAVTTIKGLQIEHIWFYLSH
jgi:hypothetical protein